MIYCKDLKYGLLQILIKPGKPQIKGTAVLTGQKLPNTQPFKSCLIYI